MDIHTWNMFVQKTLEDLENLQQTKGGEYSNKEDRLSNFKEEAAKLGISPMVVWAIYVNKHLTLIQKYVKACQDGTVGELKLSEPIEGRFKDVIIYCMLGMALEADRKAEELLNV